MGREKEIGDYLHAFNTTDANPNISFLKHAYIIRPVTNC